MADLIPVTLAGLVMDNEPDSAGVRWRVLKDGIPGWAAPTMEVARLARTGGHGTARPSAWYRARDVTVRGRILAPTFDTAWDAYYRLLGATRLGLEETLVVGEPVPKQLTVELADDPNLAEPSGNDHDGWRVPFQVPLSARYPFKRALDPVTVAVPAGAAVDHTAAGEAAAEVEVTLATAGTVDLTIGGLRLRFAALPAGAVLTSGPGFPNPARTARTAAGADLFGAIIQPMAWPAISPGANQLVQAGTADLDVRYYPTWP